MLEIVIWDVDHGSAAYINTPTGKHIAIDLGVGNVVTGDDFSPLEHLSDNYGVDRLDKLVITHPHRDHLDDIGNLALVKPRLLRVNRSIDDDYIDAGNKEEDEDIINQYKQLLEDYNSTPSNGTGGSSSTNWGCTLQHFHPVYDGPNLNNYSIVTVISYANSKIVIPGDNEGPSWKSLLKNKDFVKAIKNTDIFVASHHGRASGYYSELFDHFKPSLVVISDTNHGDTSVTDSYYYQAKGWVIDSGRTGLLDEKPRYCLTTRNDGNILIKLGTDLNGNDFMDVSTELGEPEDD